MLDPQRDRPATAAAATPGFIPMAAAPTTMDTRQETLGPRSGPQGGAGDAEAGNGCGAGCQPWRVRRLDPGGWRRIPRSMHRASAASGLTMSGGLGLGGEKRGSGPTARLDRPYRPGFVTADGIGGDAGNIGGVGTGGRAFISAFNGTISRFLDTVSVSASSYGPWSFGVGGSGGAGLANTNLDDPTHTWASLYAENGSPDHQRGDRGGGQRQWRRRLQRRHGRRCSSRAALRSMPATATPGPA